MTKEEKAAYAVKWWEKNKSRVSALRKIYYLRNQAKLVEYSRKYRSAHLDYYRDKAKQTRKNKAYWKKRMDNALKKARLRGVDIVDTDSLREYYREVFSKTTGVCTYCSLEVPITSVVIDHRVAMANGGRHEVSNLVVSCYTCNQKKTNLKLEDFLARN